MLQGGIVQLVDDVGDSVLDSWIAFGQISHDYDYYEELVGCALYQCRFFADTLAQRYALVRGLPLP